MYVVVVVLRHFHFDCFVTIETFVVTFVHFFLSISLSLSVAYYICFMLSVRSQQATLHMHSKIIRQSEDKRKEKTSTSKPIHIISQMLCDCMLCVHNFKFFFCFMKQLTSDNHSVLLCRLSIYIVQLSRFTATYTIVSSMRLGIFDQFGISFQIYRIQ